MMFLKQWRLLAGLTVGWALGLWGSPAALRAESTSTNNQPPPPAREFRGVWIASVYNIDWPSKPGLPVETQKEQMISILDRCVLLNINAVFFQVRPCSDALYDSKIEPWSEFLTGTMGKAPEPFYDPLTFAIEEAHKRGLELHAWFNPYRVAPNATLRPKPAPSSITETRPELVKRYGKYLWLDPGERDVQQHLTSVIMDVIARYDVDGVHFDDYFYPYKEKGPEGKTLDFPDEPSWKKYVDGDGKLARDDWRRENVNVLVQNLWKQIKEKKPWVKFGISPFGIWKSGVPGGVRGLSSYDALYCDARKWFAEGWLDYLAPQLYWAIDAQQQSFTDLLMWWAEQNEKNRGLWPGSTTSKVGGQWSADEIINQVKATRNQPGANGNILWNLKNTLNNRAGLSEQLVEAVYSQPALVPPMPWISTDQPTMPRLQVTKGQDGLEIEWKSGADSVWLWVLQTRQTNQWTTRILPGEKILQFVKTDAAAPLPDLVALTAINRFGNSSTTAIFEVNGSKQ